MKSKNQLSEKDKLLIRFMALAYLIDAKTDYCVFMDYAGHVSKMDFRLRENKEEYENEVCDSRFYMDASKTKDLKKRVEILEGILRDKEIDVSLLDAEIEIIEKTNYLF